MILRAKNEGDDETSTILAEVESLRIKESKVSTNAMCCASNMQGYSRN
jgi:hypothetical protein